MPDLMFIALLAQLGADPSPAFELSAAAAASPRPSVCLGAAHSPAGNETLWERAKAPGVTAYCHALARGYARLGVAPAEALRAAQAAARAMPGQAAPEVLKGRALLASAQPEQAWQAFNGARKLDRRSIEAPAALHDMGVAGLLTGHHKEALDAYRALVPRAGLLPDSWRRQCVYIEAALLAAQSGESGLNEALGYLSEARRRGSPPGFQQWVTGALALVLDRQGRSDEARGVAAEVSSYSTLSDAAERAEDGAKPVPRRSDPVLPQGEVFALAAVMSQRDRAQDAREHWQQFLKSPAGQGPWREHAQKKLSAPSSGRRGVR